MICLIPMWQFHFKVNPLFADHPYMKHKVQSTTPCMSVGNLKYNLTSAVPNEIPGEGWLTFKEFLVKSFLVGIIYFCLILIYRFSRDFLYWIDSPRRRVPKTNANRRCAEKLMGILNLLITPSNIAQHERPQNEAQFSTAAEVPDTQSIPQGS